MKIFILLSLLLTGCAANALVELADEPIGDFEPPIAKQDYVFTVYAFYLSRDTKVIDDGEKITYTALYDNRPNKRTLAKNFNPIPKFERVYPSFIRHVGIVDCNKKTNKAAVDWLDSAMKIIRSEPLNATSEVSSALCFMNELTKDR